MMSLTAGDTHLLRDVFIRIDTNGDGFVSAHDIITFVSQVVDASATTPQQNRLTSAFVEIADSDSDGLLDVFDFISAHAPGCPGIVPAAVVAHVAKTIRNVLSDADLDELQITFRAHDADDDGELSEAELTSLLRCEMMLAQRSRVDDSLAVTLARTARARFVQADDGRCCFNLAAFMRTAQESSILPVASLAVPLAHKLRRCLNNNSSITDIITAASSPLASADRVGAMIRACLAEQGDVSLPTEAIAAALIREIDLLAADSTTTGSSSNNHNNNTNNQADAVNTLVASLLRDYLHVDDDEKLQQQQRQRAIDGGNPPLLLCDTTTTTTSVVTEIDSDWSSSLRISHRIFELLDTRHSGRLGAAELAFLLPEARSAKHQERTARELVALHDLDGDGLLDFAEFLAALSHPTAPLLVPERMDACELYLGFVGSSARAASLSKAIITFPSDPVEFTNALDKTLQVFEPSNGTHNNNNDSIKVAAARDLQKRRYTRDMLLLIATEGCSRAEEQAASIRAFQQLLRSDSTIIMQLAALLTTKALSLHNVLAVHAAGFATATTAASPAARLSPTYPQQQRSGTPTNSNSASAAAAESPMVPALSGSVLLANAVRSPSPGSGSLVFGGGNTSPTTTETPPASFEASQNNPSPTNDNNGSSFNNNNNNAIPQLVREAFRCLDIHRRGALDPEIVVPIATRRFASSNRFDLRIVQRVVAALFRAFDQDGDDRLNLQEFAAAVTGPIVLFTNAELAAAVAKAASISSSISHHHHHHHSNNSGGRRESNSNKNNSASNSTITDHPHSSSSTTAAAIAVASNRDAEEEGIIRIDGINAADETGTMDGHRDEQVPLLPIAGAGGSSALSAAAVTTHLGGSFGSSSSNRAPSATGGRASTATATNSRRSTPEPRALPQSDAAYVKNLFLSLDTKRDGFIDLEELVAGGSSLLGDSKGRWTVAERTSAAKRFLANGDLDGDGVLSETEFMSCFIRGLARIPAATGGGTTTATGATATARRGIVRTTSNASPSSSSAKKNSSSSPTTTKSSSNNNNNKDKDNNTSGRSSSPSLASGSPENVETLRYLFSYIDRNRNGLISKDELKLLLREFLETHFQNDASRLAQFADEMMKEISGSEQQATTTTTATTAKQPGEEEEFTFEQFVAAFQRNPDLMRVSADAVRVRIQRTEAELERLLREEDLRRIAKVFVSLDADGNGVLDFDEVHDALVELIRSQYPDWSTVDVERTVRSIFDAADINSDGELSFEEFMSTFVNKHYSLSGFIDSHAARFRRDLTAEEVSELKSLFSFMDENNDGRVSAEELENLVAGALHMTENDDPATISAIVDSVLAIADVNRDGCMDLREFIAAYEQDSQLLDIPIMAAAARREAAEKRMNEMLCKHDLRDIAKVFLVLDKNGDGYLQADELREAIGGQLQRLHPDWPPERIEEAIESVFIAADENHDGQLSLDEFIESFVQGHYLLPPSAVRDVATTFSRKLSSDEVGQLVSLFNKIDENGDGTVSRLELERALTDAVGRETAEVIGNVIMTVADENKDGVLSIQEFLRCYQLDNGLLTVPLSGMSVTTLSHVAERLIPKQGLRRLGRMFHLLDTKQDGFVDPEELAAGLRDFGLVPHSGAQVLDVARAKVLSADIDGDGMLSLDEFIASFANAGTEGSLLLPWRVVDDTCASPKTGSSPLASRRQSMSAAAVTSSLTRSELQRLQQQQQQQQQDREEEETDPHEDETAAVCEIVAPSDDVDQKNENNNSNNVINHEASGASTAVFKEGSGAAGASSSFEVRPPMTPASQTQARNPRLLRNRQNQQQQQDEQNQQQQQLLSMSPTEHSELRALFDAADKSGNGYLEIAEFRQVYRRLESFGLPLSDRQLDMIFGPVARNGQLDFNAFCVVMLRRNRL